MPFQITYSRTKSFANGGTLLPADLNSIQDDLGNQLATANVVVGVNEGTNVRRGKSIIATIESRTNTAYGLLTTPDRVQSIVMPTDGLITVGYQATWQSSVTASGVASIFVGANQLKIANGALTILQEAVIGPTINSDYALGTYPNGLAPGTASGYAGDVTTGQVLSPAYATGAGVCYIFAAAGTYDISVQFKAGSGSVTAKNRKLWVWTGSFG